MRSAYGGFVDAWSKLPVGVDRKAPLSEIYPEAVITVDGKRLRAAEYAETRLAEEQFAGLASGEVKVELPLKQLFGSPTVAARPRTS